MAYGLREHNGPISKKGYEPDELMSALQKEIRRCNEYQAIFWAVELESLNALALWNRLRVIASEDIGLADSNATLIVDTLEKNYADAVRRNNDSYRLFLVHACFTWLDHQRAELWTIC